MFFNDKGTFNKGIKKNIEAVRQLWQDVHTGLLAGDVEALLDHLQLPDLLPVQPDDLGQVLTPGRESLVSLGIISFKPQHFCNLKPFILYIRHRISWIRKKYQNFNVC